MAAALCALLIAPLCQARNASAASSRAGPRVNLWLRAIEITQATQPWLAVSPRSESARPVEVAYSPEAIPLVRGKPTVVRVYPGLEGTTQPMSGVQAALTCQTAQESACPGPAALQPLAPVRVDPAQPGDLDILRLDAARAWLFVLPDAWTTQPEPIRLTATLTAPDGQPECYNCADRANSLILTGLAFHATAPLRLTIVYGCVRRNASDPPSACDTAPLDTHDRLLASAGSLIAQTFPLAPQDIQVILRSPVTLTVDGDPANHGAMTAERVSAFHRQVCDLAAQTDRSRAAPNEITIGLVPGPALGLLGLGSQGCSVVVVEKDSPRTADLLAEELGHALGRPHAGCKVHSSLESEPCEPTIQQFPCAHGGICTPGFNTSALRVIDPGDPPDGEHAHDFMSYGDGVQWISPYTYRHLFDALRKMLLALESPR